MANCIIFCAGGFDGLVEPVSADDYLLAADGGLVHLQALQLIPQGILGDFDSLGYVPAGAQVFPVEKDDTDSMLAVRQGLALGYRQFRLYGTLDGPRLDHTVANFQTLQYLADRDARGYLIGLHHIATVIRNDSITFPAGAQGTVSVFCMGPAATGVTLSGLQYTLEDGMLHPGHPLGVSNHFIGQSARIAVENGSLLILWDRANGFPQP